jgi:hypothetical protein
MAVVYGNKPELITNGLQLYLNAANYNSYPGSGSTWYDLSGNNRNCSWISAPSYSTDEVGGYFSTLGNRCSGPASNTFGINNTSGYTILVACRQISLVATGAFHFYSSNGSDGSASRGIFSHLTWSNDIVYIDQGGCCNSDTRTQVASGGSFTWNLWCFTKDNSSRRIYKNHLMLQQNTAEAANINLDSRNVDVVGSADYGGNSSTWNAKISAFAVYNRGLSESEVKENFSALKGRFSL